MINQGTRKPPGLALHMVLLVLFYVIVLMPKVIDDVDNM